MKPQITGRIVIKTARNLRRNQTNADKLLWATLRSIRSNEIRFRRQHPIGNYIVDFVCLEKRLVIEIDAGQHAQNAEKDNQRTKWLESEGYRIIRFWNTDVLSNIDGVGCQIMEIVNDVSPRIKYGAGSNLSPLRERD